VQLFSPAPKIKPGLKPGTKGKGKGKGKGKVQSKGSVKPMSLDKTQDASSGATGSGSDPTAGMTSGLDANAAPLLALVSCSPVIALRCVSAPAVLSPDAAAASAVDSESDPSHPRRVIADLLSHGDSWDLPKPVSVATTELLGWADRGARRFGDECLTRQWPVLEPACAADEAGQLSCSLNLLVLTFGAMDEQRSASIRGHSQLSRASSSWMERA